MASLQAHLAVWIIKWRVKRKLRGVRDYHLARKILRPDPYKVPSSVCISPAQLNGISGEWIEGPLSTNGVLLYLHGGAISGVPPKLTDRSRYPLRRKDSASSRQITASLLNIHFLPQSTMPSRPTAGSSRKAHARNRFS